jgi:hypothetical protein
MRICDTEEMINDLQTQKIEHEKNHTTYCMEIEKKLSKYHFIDNHKEIRNLRSSGSGKVNTGAIDNDDLT